MLVVMPQLWVAQVSNLCVSGRAQVGNLCHLPPVTEGLLLVFLRFSL